jgi:hypothetical protein
MIFLLSGRDTAIFRNIRTLAFLALHGSPLWYPVRSFMHVSNYDTTTAAALRLPLEVAADEFGVLLAALPIQVHIAVEDALRALIGSRVGDGLIWWRGRCRVAQQRSNRGIKGST